MLLLQGFQPQLNWGWEDRHIPDPAASAGWCTVYSSDLSRSLC